MTRTFEPDIIQATLQSDLAEVKRCIEQGKKIDVKSTEKMTALRYAIEEDNREIALELIAAGANVDLADRRGKTMLMAAIMRRQYEIMYALIRAGADISKRTKHPSSHALAVAAIHANSEIIQDLILLGANLQKDGPGALMAAIEFNKLDIVKTLTKLGLAFGVNQDDDYEFLRIAITQRHIEMVDFLLGEGITNDFSKEVKLKILEISEDYYDPTIFKVLKKFCHV